MRIVYSSRSGLQGGTLQVSQVSGAVRIIWLFAMHDVGLQNHLHCSGDYVVAEHALNVWTGIRVTWNNIFLFQAPLTSTDTAILSGNLSTQNGNGGGSINLALRRVTSAKGWGEVRVPLVCSFIFNLLPVLFWGGRVWNFSCGSSLIFYVKCRKIIF